MYERERGGKSINDPVDQKVGGPSFGRTEK